MEMSNGGKTWTFTLRDNVSFSDGTPLTANDVVATAQYILNRATDQYVDDKGYYRNRQYFIKSISSKGDRHRGRQDQPPLLGHAVCHDVPGAAR